MKTTASAVSSVEERRSKRKTLRTLGEIVVADQEMVQECTVVDLSASGAKLMLGTATRKAFAPAPALPETFRLVIPRDGITMDCRLAWREKDTVGVAFTSSFQLIKATPPRKRI